MKRAGNFLVVAAFALGGCAAPLARQASDAGALMAVAADGPGQQLPQQAYSPPRPPAEPTGDYISVADNSQADPVDIAPPVPGTGVTMAAGGAVPEFDPPSSTLRIVSQQEDVSFPFAAPEEIPPPAAAPWSRFKDDEGEIELDRFKRQIADVPVDIRPTSGVLPEDRGAEKFAAEPVIDETYPSDEPVSLFCSYTPWTICYRPLYFEDIGLERYGYNAGYLQTGLSGVRFFSSVAALPYKMTRRPPRSCECSNGFSRAGDCPLPGYGNRRFAWDAALVEAAAVTAFVYIIP